MSRSSTSAGNRALRRPLAATLRRGLATLGIVALTASVISVATTLTTATPAAASPPASAWDSGLIITDSVMFDAGKMTLGQVKSFLADKGANCVAHTNSDGSVTPCLKNYTETTYNIAAVANRCEKPYTGASNESAAAIIWKVAQACSINPQVLIVLLQKEQGLITASGSGLTPSRYNYATGFACPDTAGCDAHKSGFFRQVYSAAYGFQNYAKNESGYPQYPAFKTSSIQYKPNSSCGTQSVYIESRATRALYVYTPYVPNAAALNHPYATGDSCSSYGNRNFWLYFNDWFGSPITGTYFVDTSAGAEYLVIGGVRWKVTDDSLLSTYGALGSVGRVSTSYANSLPYGGTLGSVTQTVSGSTTSYWLMTNAGRIALSTCAQVTALGASCTALPTFTTDMINRFDVIDRFKTSDGTKYLVDGGVRYKVTSVELANALQPTGGWPTASGSVINQLPYGGEMAPVITDAASGSYWLLGGGGRIPLSGCSAVTALGYDCSQATPLSVAARAKLPEISTVAVSGGSTYVLIDGVPWKLPSGSIATAWSSAGPTASVQQSFLDALPASPGTLGRIVKDPASAAKFLLVDQGKTFTIGTCTAVHDLGYSCPTGPQLSTTLAADFPSGGTLGDDIIVGAARFHLVDPPAVSSPPAIYPRVKKQILTTWSALHAGVDFGANGTVTLSADAASALTYGAPYVDAGSVFTSGSGLYVAGAAATYSISASLQSQTDIRTWLGASAGVLDAQSVALMPSMTPFTGVYKDARTGSTYMLTSTRPVVLTTTSSWPAGVATVDAALIDALPAPSATAYGPDLFVRYAVNGIRYFVQDGVRHPLASLDDKDAIAAAYGVSDGTPNVALDTLTALGPLGSKMIPPAQVYRTTATSTQYWYIDGSSRRLVSKKAAVELTGSSSIRTISSTYLAGYPRDAHSMTIGLVCDGQRYLAEGGAFRPISAADGAEYPVTFTDADPLTCAARPHFAAMGTLVDYKGTYYRIADGKRSIVTATSYAKLVAAGAVAAPSVDSVFLALIPAK